MFQIFFLFLIAITLPIIFIKLRPNYDDIKNHIFEFLIFTLIKLKNAKERLLTYVYRDVNFVTKEKDIMKIKYYYDGETYNIIMPIVLGPRPIKRITKLNGEELLLRKFMGPYGNFHNIHTTPKMLGFDENIMVYYRNRENIEYKSDEIIKINT